MRFSVGIVGYSRAGSYTRCFEDLGRAIADALRALGHEVVPAHDARPGRLIMLGANNVVDVAGTLPEDAIVFNTEQMSAFRDPRVQFQAHVQYRRHAVWDYSKTNIEILRGIGLERLVHCPIGYVPSMTRIEPAAAQDIDVLFYGAISERRRQLLRAIDATGLRLETPQGVFGRDLDPWIARSKVVLNAHFYERPVFEIVRCSHLFANKKCVVTEDGGLDEELESVAQRCADRRSYEELVRACQFYVRSEVHRQVREDVALKEFKKLDFAESVRVALEQS